MKKIGFIGLGHMGAPIAEGLLNSGCDVLGYDLSESAYANFQGPKTKHLKDIALHAQVIITMLPSGVELMSLYQQQELISHLSKDTLLIDCSTIGPIAAQKFHALPYPTVDAPVSGGVIAAQNNQLAYIIGADEPFASQAETIFKPISKQIIRTGGPCTGQIAKTCNNMVLANTMIAVSEAFLLAQELGLEAKALLEVLQSSSGNCWVVDKYLPVPNIMENVPANKAYAPGFTNKMMRKDLHLAGDAAKKVHLNLQLTQKAQELYEHLNSPDFENLDFSSIYLYLKKSN
jgi:3-hydroxyisobutyrate dehydrogenase